MNEDGKIALVTGVGCALRYHMSDCPGATKHPFLRSEVITRLLAANRCVERLTDGHGSLLLWDALRTLEMQQFLYDQQSARVKEAEPWLAAAELDEKVAKFVRRPDEETPPPHCTGGAVDVTITYDGKPLPLGSFDDFSDRSASDFFDHHEPIDPVEECTAQYRGLLWYAMVIVGGFVAIREEWWHFEYGTRHWAHETQAQVIYDKIVVPPVLHGPATSFLDFPFRQPVLFHGVAHSFASAEQRADALAAQGHGFYYVRSGHPTATLLAKQLERFIGYREWTLTPSGLNACVTAVAALMPTRGHLIIDKFSYYESVTAFWHLAEKFGWRIHLLDLTDPTTHTLVTNADVIFFDSPRNWYLDAPRMVDVVCWARKIGATIVCDTSVQPMQRTAQAGVDVTVLSLSKYPSSGLTCGGAIGTNCSALADIIRNEATQRGDVMAPETAATILQHAQSLPDRMEMLSRKALALQGTLSESKFVRKIRLPTLESPNEFLGGQISFHTDSIQRARTMERIVAENTLDPAFSLSLACTFGATFSTFEHFGGNPRCRVSRSASDTTEMSMPLDLIRIGIGHEPLENIKRSVEFVLEASRWMEVMEP